MKYKPNDNVTVFNEFQNKIQTGCIIDCINDSIYVIKMENETQTVAHEKNIQLVKDVS